MILITGAGGMLGSYLREQFQDEQVTTLGLRPESDFVIDLRKDIPHFNNVKFDTVIHTAGTENDSEAMDLNLEGTKRLIKALEDNPPSKFVYISSYKVYSRDAGEKITEENNTWATSEAGKSKALTEQFIRDWCGSNGIILTIIRPARMFGNGVKGETLELFNDAVNAKYIHIRGNDAKVSIVCAIDVAKGIKALYTRGGIYNASDGRDIRYIDMVEAMTANAGGKKRMTHLPAPWAEWIWRLFQWIPSINRNLAPEVVANRMKTLTINGEKFAKAAGLEYFDTISVIERTNKNYPYTEGIKNLKENVREV